MSVVLQSRQLAARRAALTASGANDIIPLYGSISLATTLGINNILEMVELPAGYVPVDVKITVTDLDTNGSPTIAFKAGVMTGNVGDTVFANRTCGAEFMTGKTTAQAGGLVAADVAAGYQLAPSTSPRALGVQFTAAAATAAAGTLTMTVMARPQLDGE